MSRNSIALAACMRNEGVFLMEWIAHHAGLGFDRIIVVSNDCLDGSDLLLDRLDERGLITHIRQSLNPGDNPQRRGMDHVLSLCRRQGHSHVLHIDSDEFVDLAQNGASIGSLLEMVPDADVIPLPWRFFGDAGLYAWTPGDLVIAANPFAERRPDPKVTKFKCLFRVAAFAAAGDHAPMQPLIPDPVVKSPNGELLSNETLWRKHMARWKPQQPAGKTKAAWLSHYAVRSLDVFLMKNDRGKGTGDQLSQKYMAGAKWYQVCNRNDERDDKMRRYLPALRARLAEWRQDPETARLEQACQAWFVDRRQQILTEEVLEAWTLCRDASAEVC